MPKNWILLARVLSLNLWRAADLIHCGSFAYGVAVASVAFLQTGEIFFGLWLAALTLMFVVLTVQAVHGAWTETVRELNYAPPVVYPRRRVYRKPPHPNWPNKTKPKGKRWKN